MRIWRIFKRVIECFDCTHAGGVVYREQGERLEFLIVRSSKGNKWVLPKGHIEPGEHPEIAAVREVREEAAVRAEIVAPLGVVNWLSSEKEKRVAFYFMRAVREVPPEEARESMWLPFEDAVCQLRRAEARWLLEEAQRLALAS